MSRRLYRSKRDVLVGGVAAGIADYFDLDPTLVRLVWILTVLFGGFGVLLYIIAWIVIPPEPGPGASERFRRTEAWREKVIDAARDVERQLKRSDDPKAANGDAETAAPPAQTAPARQGAAPAPESAVEPHAAGHERSGPPGSEPPAGEHHGSRRRLAGLVLVVLGAFFLLREMVPWVTYGLFWPLALIAAGLFIMVRGVGGAGR